MPEDSCVTVTLADSSSASTLASSKMMNPSTVHIGRSLTVKGITPMDTVGMEVTESRCPSWPAITSALPTW
jgi:hypothetical protein